MTSGESETAIVRYWKIVKAIPVLGVIALAVVLGEGLRMLNPRKKYEPQHVRIARKASEQHGKTTNQKQHDNQDNE